MGMAGDFSLLLSLGHCIRWVCVFGDAAGCDGLACPVSRGTWSDFRRSLGELPGHASYLLSEKKKGTSNS